MQISISRLLLIQLDCAARSENANLTRGYIDVTSWSTSRLRSIWLKPEAHELGKPSSINLIAKTDFVAVHSVRKVVLSLKPYMIYFQLCCGQMIYIKLLLRRLVLFLQIHEHMKLHAKVVVLFAFRIIVCVLNLSSIRLHVVYTVYCGFNITFVPQQTKIISSFSALIFIVQRKYRYSCCS